MNYIFHMINELVKKPILISSLSSNPLIDEIKLKIKIKIMELKVTF